AVHRCWRLGPAFVCVLALPCYKYKGHRLPAVAQRRIAQLSSARLSKKWSSSRPFSTAIMSLSLPCFYASYAQTCANTHTHTHNHSLSFLVFFAVLGFVAPRHSHHCFPWPFTG